MPAPVFEQFRGAQFNYFVRVADADGPVDLTAIPITLLLTSPTGAVTALRHLNGGTDGTLSDAGATLSFVKDATWTAANLVPGEYELILCEGAKATTQKPILRCILYVRDARSAPLPTS